MSHEFTEFLISFRFENNDLYKRKEIIKWSLNLKLYDKKKPIDLQWGVVVNHDYSTAISLNCGGNYRLRQNLETFMAF